MCSIPAAPQVRRMADAGDTVMNDSASAADGAAPVAETQCKLSEAELSTAIHVLNTIGDDDELFKSKPLRMLRKALMPVLKKHSKQFFDGVDPLNYEWKKTKRSEVRRQRLQLAAMDKQYINKTKLRAERLEKLKSLTEQGDEGQDLLLIPDGVAEADAGAVAPAMLTDGSATAADATPEAASGEGPIILNKPRSCYVCKCRYKQLHRFYDQLCPRCAGLNYAKREQKVDLSGKVFLVTGSRVKIGFRCVLKLLRCGATVVATSRFPKDSVRRYAAESDYNIWSNRLHIVGLDLRNIVAIEEFCAMMNSHFNRLDGIVNNACQTIRRPTGFYQHLMDREETNVKALPAPQQHNLAANEAFHETLLRKHGSDMRALPTVAASSASAKPAALTLAGTEQADPLQSTETNAFGTIPATGSSSATASGESSTVVTASADGSAGHVSSASASQIQLLPEDKLSPEEHAKLFPQGKVDVNEQQIDLRKQNSWLLKLHEVSTPELAEVFAINTLAPFILNARLRPLLEAGEATAADYAADVEVPPAIPSRAGKRKFREAGADGDDSAVEAGAPNASHELYEVTLGGDSVEVQQGTKADASQPVHWKFIVNVSAMEGKFYRHKTPHHPHTNMAKAALNMMTRTCADDLARSNIYMSAVDTGWINDENPLEKANRVAKENNFQTPLDEIDAAARVLDPILAPFVALQHGVAAKPVPGVFLKNYKLSEW